jgi:acetyl-CoA synthetase (ADP-forming)
MELAKAIVEFYKENNVTKTTVVSMIGGADVEQAIKYLNRNGIPAYPTPEEAVFVLSRMLMYKRYLERIKKAS